jgi:drug/metabolite transporter (DMT)-like permease
MSPGLWGLLTAGGWGGADFIARFTGRAVGPGRALFGAFLLSALTLAAVAWGVGLPLGGPPEQWWLIAGSGVGVAGATFLLYWGLARGPIAVVSPIVGSYPAFNLAIALFEGVRPSAVQWMAMAAVMGGVFLVAHGADGHDDEAPPPGGLRATIGIALGSSIGFALAIDAMQGAAEVYGEMQTVLLGRCVVVLVAGLVLACRRRPLSLPRAIWPLIALQGLFDGGAYLALVQSKGGTGEIIAVVVASAFWAITVLLAWLVIKERVTPVQWGGIALIAGGVAALSA